MNNQTEIERVESFLNQAEESIRVAGSGTGPIVYSMLEKAEDLLVMVAAYRDLPDELETRAASLSREVIRKSYKYKPRGQFSST